MGMDISSYVEVKNKETGEWEYQSSSRGKGEVFDTRSYGLFGFLADMRNWSQVPPILGWDEPRRGLPTDSSWLEETAYEDWGSSITNKTDLMERNGHGFSWLTLKELQDYDYTQTFEDLRVTRQTGPNSWDGGVTGEPGEGEVTTLAEFLGGNLTSALEKLKQYGEPDDVRVIFWFD